MSAGSGAGNTTAGTQQGADGRKRTALGKGLESLLGPRVTQAPAASAAAPAAAVAPAEPAGKPLEIDVTKIERNPFQTRTKFDETLMAELTASVKAAGVVQPIVVRELGSGRYQLIMGERRWRASQAAGRTTIPAIVRQVSDEQAMEMTIIENLQRADLNPMEQARAYDRLGREFAMTHEQMANRTGKDRTSVANFLRLLKLPEQVQMGIEAGALSFGHGRALLALPNPSEMEFAAAEIIEQAMSVRQTELYIQKQLSPETRAAKSKTKMIEPLDANVRDAQERLQRALGLKVAIVDRGGKGKVVIEYSGVDDFDSLLEALGGSK